MQYIGIWNIWSLCSLLAQVHVYILCDQWSFQLIDKMSHTDTLLFGVMINDNTAKNENSILNFTFIW